MTNEKRPRATEGAMPKSKPSIVEMAYETIEGATAARYMAATLRDMLNDQPLPPAARDTVAFILVALAERADDLAGAILDRIEEDDKAERVAA